jgi:PAS domain S-box-containing protein
MDTPQSTPIRPRTATAAARNWPPLWLPLVVLCCIALAAGAYSSYARSVRRSTETLLLSLARARATAIEAHLDERTADAWFLARRSRVLEALNGGEGTTDPVRLAYLNGAMRDAATAYGYHNVILLGRDAQVIGQLHEDTLRVRELNAIATTIRSGEAQPILVHTAPDGVVEYGVVSPVWATSDTTGPAAGALYLVLDVTSRLFPILRDGVPGRSFQTVLIQTVGDSAVSFAASAVDSAFTSIRPALYDARQVERILRGRDSRDFRGVEVIRGVARVTGAPWVIIAKIDRDEAERPIRLAAMVIGLAVALLIALAAAITRAMGERARRQVLMENQRIAERMMRLVQTSTDGYIVLDATGQIVEVNEATAIMTGTDAAALVGRSLADFKVVDDPTDVATTLERIRREGGSRHVSRWRRPDGSVIDLDVSATWIDDAADGLIYAFLRDVTMSLASRRRLERVNRLYAFLNHAGEALFQARSRDEAFSAVARIAVEEGGFPLVWIGALEADGTIQPVVAHGDAVEYVRELHITVDPTLPTSQGPTGRAVRAGKPMVVGDFQHDPTTRPWHDIAQRHGIQSAAALPVMVDGRAVASINFYDREPNAFDAERIALLEEIARIAALVLQTAETEARRAEEQERRRRSEERFRSHFESLPIATYVVHEATGQVQRVNRAFVTLFGYEAYDVPTLEASFDRFFADPVYRAQTFEVFRRDLGELRPGATPRRSREYTIRCRDGSERVVQAIVTRAGEELIIGWLDLSELRTSQVMLREAQQIARLGSWRYDFRSKKRELSDDTLGLFDIDRANRNTEAIMAAAFEPEDLERIKTEFFRAIRDNETYEITVPLRTRRNERRHVMIRARVEYDDRGYPLRAVGSAQDVTTQVEAANELARYREHLEELVEQRTEALASANAQLAQAYEAADAANRAKSAFLAIMSHEIRTPLNGVIGMAEVLAQSPLPSRDAEAVRIIRGSATNLLGIIDDILDFSKIEAGRIELEHVEVSLSEMLDGVQSALTPLADARHVDVSIFIAPDVPDRVVTDGMRVRQICYNLIGNAIKFSGGRTGVRGAVAVRVVAEGTDPLRVAIEVRDNGIGMSSDTMQHLFTSFTQAELSTTRRFGGTGLGLAICKRLADLLGGTIGVESQLGAGSTFKVVLPFEAAATQDAPGADITGVPCVVQRDPLARQEADDIATFLLHGGAMVHVVETLDEAIARLQSLPRPAVFIRHAPAVVQQLEDLPPASVHFLHLTDGRRRVPRLVSPQLVTLDRRQLRSASLVHAVALAAGRAVPDTESEELPAAPMPSRRSDPVSIEQARAAGRLILVAEDDEVNQKVILQQLELLGYAAEIARNGTEALGMWERGAYALLLTDLSMPQMDGYELTRRIRETEEASGLAQRLPIIALTANALRGEELRARDRGMDEFLTKPVLLGVLRETLARFVEPGEPPPLGATSPPVTLADGALDPAVAPRRTTVAPLSLQVLRDLVGDDPQVVRDFLHEYHRSATAMAAEARLAITQGDLVTVARVFHKLKSSSRSIGALPLGDLSNEIETAARDRDVRAVERLAAPFEVAVSAVLSAVAAELQ